MILDQGERIGNAEGLTSRGDWEPREQVFRTNI